MPTNTTKNSTNIAYKRNSVGLRSDQQDRLPLIQSSISKHGNSFIMPSFGSSSLQSTPASGSNRVSKYSGGLMPYTIISESSPKNHERMQQSILRHKNRMRISQRSSKVSLLPTTSAMMTPGSPMKLPPLTDRFNM